MDTRLLVGLLLLVVVVTADPLPDYVSITSVADVHSAMDDAPPLKHHLSHPRVRKTVDGIPNFKKSSFSYGKVEEVKPGFIKVDTRVPKVESFPGDDMSEYAPDTVQRENDTGVVYDAGDSKNSGDPTTVMLLESGGTRITWRRIRSKNVHNESNKSLNNKKQIVQNNGEMHSTVDCAAVGAKISLVESEYNAEIQKGKSAKHALTVTFENRRNAEHILQALVKETDNTTKNAQRLVRKRNIEKGKIEFTVKAITTARLQLSHITATVLSQEDHLTATRAAVESVRSNLSSLKVEQYNLRVFVSDLGHEAHISRAESAKQSYADALEKFKTNAKLITDLKKRFKELSMEAAKEETVLNQSLAMKKAIISSIGKLTSKVSKKYVEESVVTAAVLAEADVRVKTEKARQSFHALDSEVVALAKDLEKINTNEIFLKQRLKVLTSNHDNACKSSNNKVSATDGSGQHSQRSLPSAKVAETDQVVAATNLVHATQETLKKSEEMLLRRRGEYRHALAFLVASKDKMTELNLSAEVAAGLRNKHGYALVVMMSDRVKLLKNRLELEKIVSTISMEYTHADATASAAKTTYSAAVAKVDALSHRLHNAHDEKSVKSRNDLQSISGVESMTATDNALQSEAEMQQSLVTATKSQERSKIAVEDALVEEAYARHRYHEATAKARHLTEALAMLDVRIASRKSVYEEISKTAFAAQSLLLKSKGIVQKAMEYVAATEAGLESSEAEMKRAKTVFASAVAQRRRMLRNH